VGVQQHMQLAGDSGTSTIPSFRDRGWIHLQLGVSDEGGDSSRALFSSPQKPKIF